MNLVTIRKAEHDYLLKLDFNRNIQTAIGMYGISCTSEDRVTSLTYKQVINPCLTFNENGIRDNEIIEIEERYEDEL